MNPVNDQLPVSSAQAGWSARAVDADRHLLSELAASFAHELNQPLAAIAAYAEGAATLLRRDPGGTMQALGIVEAIAGQALRAGEVIRQLRGAVRPMPGTHASLDLNALVRAVQPLLQALATEHAVRLVVELRTPAPPVLVDAARLQTLLLLLYAGALETVDQLPPERRQVTIATDEGEYSVELSATHPGGTLFAVHLPRVPT